MTDFVKYDQPSVTPIARTRRGVRTRRALIVAGATAAALAVWALAGPIGGVDIAARSGGSVQQIGPGAVAVSSMLAGLAGWGLLACLERLMKRPHRTWTVTASVVFVLSLTGPLGGVGTAAKLTLFCLHLVVAAVLIAGLPRAAR
jgi:Family of unknown function (DUF6069)